MHRTGPRGLGRSYVDGLRHALATTDADFICQMDADLSHSPEYLPDLVNAAGQFDVVIGSRYLNGVSVVNWPLHRIFLSAFANKYIGPSTRHATPAVSAAGAGAGEAAPGPNGLDGCAFLVGALRRWAAWMPDWRDVDHLVERRRDK
jgi:hypothetical protein